MSDDRDVRVVRVSSGLEDTPEGMARMDRLRRSEDRRRAALSPAERELEDLVTERMDRLILEGDRDV